MYLLDICRQVAFRLNKDEQEVSEITTAVINGMKDILKEGVDVRIPGFGVFKPDLRLPRTKKTNFKHTKFLECDGLIKVNFFHYVGSRKELWKESLAAKVLSEKK